MLCPSVKMNSSQGTSLIKAECYSSFSFLVNLCNVTVLSKDKKASMCTNQSLMDQWERLSPILGGELLRTETSSKEQKKRGHCCGKN